MSLKEISELEKLEVYYDKAQSSFSILKYVLKAVLNSSVGMFLLFFLLCMNFIIASFLYFNSSEPADGFYFLTVLIFEVALLILLVRLVNSYKDKLIKSAFKFLENDDLKEFEKENHDVVFIAHKFLFTTKLMENRELVEKWLLKNLERQEHFYFDLRSHKKPKIIEVFDDHINQFFISCLLGLVGIYFSINATNFEAYLKFISGGIISLVFIIMLRILYVFSRNDKYARNKFYAMTLLKLKLNSI